MIFLMVCIKKAVISVIEKLSARGLATICVGIIFVGKVIVILINEIL